jgi:hypothetical protein
MASAKPPKFATKTATASANLLTDLPVWRIVSWMVAMGLVITQGATVFADSKTAWFARLCVSILLFGILACVRTFEARRHRRGSIGSGALDPESVDHCWNWFTLGAMTLILVAGLVKAPHRSNDVYAYGAYGRLVSEHSVSPYTTRPSAFPNDPVIARMAPGWRNTRSVYGPAFTAVSAIGMRVAGTSALAERLWFQTLAAAATACSALILKRMSPRHWWLFALNPVSLVAVAHDGHNDALMGLGILSALWFLHQAHGNPQKRSRFIHWAAASLVFAASIKITAILAVPALTVWIIGQFGWKRATRIAAPWAVVCVGLFAATGGPTAFAAFRGLRTFRSTTSLWHLDLVRRLTDRAGGKPGVLALTIPAAALLTTGLLVLVRSWSDLRARQQTQKFQTFEQLKAEEDAHAAGDVKTPDAGWQASHQQNPGDTHTYDIRILASMTLLPLVVFIALGLYTLPWYWGWLLAPAMLLPVKFRATVMFAAATHTMAYGTGTLLHGRFATVLQIARFGTPLGFVVTVVTGCCVLFGRDQIVSDELRASGSLST